MENYSLEMKASVARDLRRIPTKDLRRILAQIEHLARDPGPLGCEKLSGLERYRIRQGMYRILYEVNDATRRVLIVKVAHRREAYR
jgi:mRNA interferase RelE/StbE